MAMLVPELVPEPLWRLSAHQLFKRSIWNKIRTEILTQQENTCAICGDRRDKRMVCHEAWSYDDASAIATLNGFDIHCPDCDAVQHIGQTGVWGDREEAIKHMAKVNGTTADEARRLVADAFQTWKRRSGIPWRVDVDLGVLARFPELDCLVGLEGSPGEGRRRISSRA
ncbi:MAG TPA: hypothetical protein VND98_08795 [Solirubrobacterales bacterium]|nr:hypothetical protein [Solirubrobacterales bacterium]